MLITMVEMKVVVMTMEVVIEECHVVDDVLVVVCGITSYVDEVMLVVEIGHSCGSN